MRISKWHFMLTALVLGCVSPSVTNTVSAQTYQCATSQNGKANQLETYIVGVVTGTDSNAVQARAHYQLPTTTASKVSYVTQASTCRTAALDFYTAVGAAPPTSGTIPVTVVKVGNTRYVVSVIGYHAGEFSMSVTFDGSWHPLVNVIF